MCSYFRRIINWIDDVKRRKNKRVEKPRNKSTSETEFYNANKLKKPQPQIQIQNDRQKPNFVNKVIVELFV